MKKQKGITLIALVITIIVMIILAGVAINLTLGDNGIFTKATDAKILTRASSAEEEVILWKTENLTEKYTDGEQTSSETMLENLKTKNLVYEEEIDREEKVIRIKKKDGTIVKEIAYGDTDSRFIVGNNARIGTVYDCIVLIDKKLNIDEPYSNFEKAYVVLNGKKIEITSLMNRESDLQYSHIAVNHVYMFLKTNNLVDDSIDFEDDEYESFDFILIKDNVEYFGSAIVKPHKE